MVESINRKKVSHQVYEQLEMMIRDGKFPPNSKLPTENELAKMFGVSRSPIREALSVLAASGLIESRQGGGSWVKEVQMINMLDRFSFEMIEVEEVYHLLEMRTIIETEAAALAAERHTDQDIKELELALNAFRQTLEDEKSVGSEADFEFHRVIVRATYNPFFIQTIDNLADLYQKALHYSLKKNIGSTRKREEVFKEHEAIFLAIKERNKEKARQTMQHHLNVVRLKVGDPNASVYF
ncbi:FadR/GntR family transcriptional regulator [Bacillus pinisoli]|uniref:FadR/GntR family transcriptional regulator n=1 Tax=Bacillus pinisoli TaxID=2901866 RepID=UPI001FF48EB5|nr:FadR/GntR family transcriptional regulator [Bacillus pinisoli]